MTAQEFCYWLNGFAELTPEPPTEAQWQSIKEHLALSFHKVTPVAPGALPQGWQQSQSHFDRSVTVTC